MSDALSQAERIAQLREGASAAFELFEQCVQVGFTRAEALELVKTLLAVATRQGE